MNLIISSENFLNLILQAADKNSGLYIEAYVRRCLTSLVKTADPDVKRLFFPEENEFAFDRITLLSNEELSARYILYTLSGCQQRPDLANLIKEKSYGHVSRFISFHAESIGEMIYGLYLNAFLLLPETAEDSEAYFNELKQRLVTTNFEAVTKTISISHSPAPAQLILSALKILDSVTYNAVLLAWAQSDFFSKEFPDLELLHLLESYPWLEACHADLLSGNLIDGIVQGAKKEPDTVKEWIKTNVNRYALF